MCIWKVEVQDRQCKFCKVCNCTDRISQVKKYSNLRQNFEHLKRGESVEVPIDHYANYRTVLSRYNKNCETKYIATRKVGDKLYLVRYR